MKKIGMIVAVEIKDVLNQYAGQIADKMAAGHRVLEYKSKQYRLLNGLWGQSLFHPVSEASFFVSDR